MARGSGERVTVSIKGADVESQPSGPCTTYHNYSWTYDEQNHSSLGRIRRITARYHWQNLIDSGLV